MELNKIRRAVEMTAQCKSVDWWGPLGSDKAFSAVLWCNAVGECVVGLGPDAWTAVQAAYALREMYTNNPAAFPR